MTKDTKVKNILKIMGFDLNKEHGKIVRFTNEEDGADYDVWKITIAGSAYVLKKAKGNELKVYSEFLRKLDKGVPHLYKSVKYDNDDYFLMDYVEGITLSKCCQSDLLKAVDALIYIQNLFWETKEPLNYEYSFEKTLENRQNRGKYLNDQELEKAYGKFLEYYQRLPRTLCHDDLLPFNILIDHQATIIDWEYAGILPYPTSLVRMIAHSEEDKKALFFMKESDKEFIVKYYYDHLLKDKGISYLEYQKTLNYFLLYEYCEWIMLGVKYQNTDTKRYQDYYRKAKELLKVINK